MADPNDATPVLRDFTCKQIFHVLITGGGFFDVMVPIPLCATTGSVVPLLIVCSMVVCLLLAAHPAAPRRWRRMRGGRSQGEGSSTRTLKLSELGAPAADGGAPPPANGRRTASSNSAEVVTITSDAL